MSCDELVEWSRTQCSGYEERFADRVSAALAAEQFRAPAHLVRAKVDTIQLTAAQLLLLGASGVPVAFGSLSKSHVSSTWL